MWRGELRSVGEDRLERGKLGAENGVDVGISWKIASKVPGQ